MTPFALTRPELGSARARPKVRHLRLVAGLVGLSLVNTLNLNTIPLVNGAWADELHLSSAVVGALLTEQILIASAVAIGLSTQLHRLSARRSGILAGLTVLAADLWLASADQVWGLAAGCALVGVGTGCLQACAAATIATAQRVDRTAAFLQVGLTILVAALTLPLSHVAAGQGRHGLFLVQAVVVAGACGLTLAVPPRAPPDARDRPVPLLQALVSPVVLAWIGLQLGTMGVWAFTERIGVRVGLTTVEVGDALAGSTLLAISGGLLAAWLSRRGSERFWAIVGVIAFGASTSLLAASVSAPMFIATVYAQAFTYVFLMPFLTAVAVSHDRTGGLAAAAQGWSSLIGSGAPALAGVLVATNSFNSLAFFTAVASALTVTALVAIRRRSLP